MSIFLAIVYIPGDVGCKGRGLSSRRKILHKCETEILKYTHYSKLVLSMVLSTLITQLLSKDNPVYAIQCPYYLQVYKHHILTSTMVAHRIEMTPVVCDSDNMTSNTIFSVTLPRTSIIDHHPLLEQ